MCKRSRARKLRLPHPLCPLPRARASRPKLSPHQSQASRSHEIRANEVHGAGSPASSSCPPISSPPTLVSCTSAELDRLRSPTRPPPGATAAVLNLEASDNPGRCVDPIQQLSAARSPEPGASPLALASTDSLAPLVLSLPRRTCLAWGTQSLLAERPATTLATTLALSSSSPRAAASPRPHLSAGTSSSSPSRHSPFASSSTRTTRTTASMGLFNRRANQGDEGEARQPFSWKLPRQASSLAPEDVYTNADLDPTTDPAQRTWGYGTWVRPPSPRPPAALPLEGERASAGPRSSLAPTSRAVLVLGRRLARPCVLADGREPDPARPERRQRHRCVALAPLLVQLLLPLAR